MNDPTTIHPTRPGTSNRWPAGRAFLRVAGCLFGASVVATAELTPEAIDSLPAPRREAWQAYWQRSRELAANDRAALEAELAAHGLEAARPAPDGGDFKLSAKPGDPWFGGAQAGQLAGIVISYQTPAGGWSKHTGYSKGPREPGMQWSSQYDPGSSPHYLGTFDNRSTTEQLQFLAGIAQATGRDDCRASFNRGLDYILAAQYPHGGWPQVFPLEGDYHDDVTLNDDAMTRILELLEGIASGDGHFAFLDAAKRAEAAAALKRGIDCVMRIQVRQGDRLAGWCAQYEALTLEPAPARKMEPTALVSIETGNLLKILMRIREPKPELRASIEGGLAWLERVEISGLRKTKRDGKTVYVEDPASTETYWARFYDLADNRPLFPGRDGVIYDSFNEMARHNELGYDYYSTRPSGAIGSSQKKWRKQLAKAD